MKTKRQRLRVVKMTLMALEKEVRDIAEHVEAEAEQQPNTTRGGIRRSKLNEKAYYLHGCADEIKNAQTQAFY